MNIFNQCCSTVGAGFRFVSSSLVLVFILMSESLAASASWGRIYVYEKPDGNHVITSQKINNNRFSLVKVYKAKKATKLINKPNGKKRKKGSRCGINHIRAKASAYKHPITMYSRMYNVDAALVTAIIKNESCFKVKAHSRAGAIGLMQLMPNTAKHLQVSNPWNPQQNIQGGVKYIAEMLDLFNNNTRLALAAYNAGPANVKKYDGIPPYQETRTYVTRVMNDYRELKATGVFSL